MKQAQKLLCLILALLFLLPSCAPALSLTEEKTVEETKTEATEETTAEENEKTEDDTPQIMQKEDPKADDTVYILMIGNSFCSYYVDELYQMAKAAGIQTKIYNLYYSGCTIPKHWSWFQTDSSEYKLFTTDEKGRRSKSNISLRGALRQENWDMISLQNTGGTLGVTMQDTEKIEKTKKSVLPKVKDLYDYIREQFPMSELYWHETWAFEVGYNRSSGKVETKEVQDEMRLVTRAIQGSIPSENNVKLIPTGEAWYLARQNPVIGDTLCQSSAKNNGAGDHYHDGQEGGGQYLNACTWFEVLMGKSCIGNAFRPDYELSEEKIAILQKTAHQAVADVYGEAYAK